LNLVFDLRGVACESGTLQGRWSEERRAKSQQLDAKLLFWLSALGSPLFQYLAEESNPVLQIRNLPC
jgi:hypothetical protein